MATDDATVELVRTERPSGHGGTVYEYRRLTYAPGGGYASGPATELDWIDYRLAELAGDDDDLRDYGDLLDLALTLRARLGDALEGVNDANG